MTRYVYSLGLSLVASPAIAHHEVATTTSVLPLAAGFAVFGLAAFAAIRKRLGMVRRNKRLVPIKSR